MRPFPPIADARRHAAQAGALYFGGDHTVALAVPMPQTTATPTGNLYEAPLPDWAADIAPTGYSGLLVDACCVSGANNGDPTEGCDWLYAAALHLDSWLEKMWEAEHGPIHSYALSLPRKYSPAYDHAWANRIFLLLRRWAARRTGQDEAALFGPLPTGAIALTHDVDALRKTFPQRVKKVAMDGVSAVRLAARGRFGHAWARVRGGARFALTNSDYRLFDDVLALENGKPSAFMFYARSAGSRTLRERLLDCDYEAPEAAPVIRQLAEARAAIGIHPGVRSWNDSARIADVRAQISQLGGVETRLCRQHWLRFGLNDTWRAQSAAGVDLDLTLGFNDRPGFRSGAALRYAPLGVEGGLEIIPTILMDSQFYDYDFPRDPWQAIQPWLQEVAFVGGQAAVLWHVHTMHEDFGWAGGYRALLSGAEGLGLQFMDLAK